MSFDPLLLALGLSALATATDPTTFAPTAARSAVRIAPAALPSAPGIGDLAIDSGDGNKLKWFTGVWNTPAVAAGVANGNIQFYENGALGYSPNLVYDTATKQLQLTSDVMSYVVYADSTAQVSTAAPTVGVGVAGQQALLVDAVCGGGTLIGVRGSASVAFLGAGSTSSVTLLHGMDVATQVNVFAAAGNTFAVGNVNAQYVSQLFEAANPGAITINEATGAVYTRGINVANVDGALTLTRVFGVKVEGDTPTVSSGTLTVGTIYGLYLGAICSGIVPTTARYGIYQDDADATNYWAGNNLLVPKALPTGVAGLLVIDSGDSNKLKWYDGATWQTAGGGGGTPAGADTQIQFNNAGAFGASAKLTWTDSTGTLYISSNGPGTADAIDILLFPTSTDIGDGFLVAAIGSTTSISVDSVTTSGDAYGLSVSSAVSFGASGVVNDVIGVDSTALATTSLNSYVDDVGAFRATATLDNIVAGTLTVPRLFGLSVNASITASGSGAVAVTSAYGVEVRPVSLGANATISTWYGLYLGAVTGGTVTNRYGIYQADASATNAFSGFVSITRAPSTVSGNFQSVQNLADAASAGAYSNVYLGTNYTSSGNSVSVTSIRADVNISGITATSVNGAFGFNSSIVSTKSAGVIGELTSYRAGLSNASGCTVNTLRGFYTPQTINGAVGTGYGLHVETSGSGAVTTYYGLRLQLGASAVTNHYGVYQEGATVLNYFEGSIQIVNKDVILGTGAGTKIGTATSQKLGFFNSTPVVQPNTTGETAGFTAGGGVAVDDASTFTGNVGATAYRISDIVKHLKNLGLIAA